MHTVTGMASWRRGWGRSWGQQSTGKLEIPATCAGSCHSNGGPVRLFRPVSAVGPCRTGDLARPAEPWSPKLVFHIHNTGLLQNTLFTTYRSAGVIRPLYRSQSARVPTPPLRDIHGEGRSGVRPGLDSGDPCYVCVILRYQSCVDDEVFF